MRTIVVSALPTTFGARMGRGGSAMVASTGAPRMHRRARVRFLMRDCSITARLEERVYSAELQVRLLEQNERLGNGFRLDERHGGRLRALMWSERVDDVHATADGDSSVGRWILREGVAGAHDVRRVGGDGAETQPAGLECRTDGIRRATEEIGHDGTSRDREQVWVVRRLAVEAGERCPVDS